MSETKTVELPAIYGVKAGMTRIFDGEGNHVPVTVIKLIPNIVSQVKTKNKDGHEAYQVAYYEKREKLVNKPIKGHLKKANIEKNLCRFFEIKVDKADDAHLGAELSVETFKSASFVDVTATSKGKGFQGVIKRHHFGGGPASHGSHFHRIPGSIGNRATPARVFKLKKLPGHMGSVRVTTQNLAVVDINIEKGYMLIKGAVPGSRNSFVKVARAIKKA